MVEAIRPGTCPPLPDVFEANHDREDTTSTTSAAPPKDHLPGPVQGPGSGDEGCSIR
ncbi:MAG: hypothetical protein WKF75_21810 [Singulisphaera sp.]